MIDVLKEAKQEVPAKLYEFASQSHRFGKNIRKRYGGGGGFYGSSSFGNSRFTAGGGSRFSSNGFSNGYSNNGGNVSNGFVGGMKRKYDDNNRFGNSGGKRPNFGNGTHSSSTTSNTDRFNSYA